MADLTIVTIDPENSHNILNNFLSEKDFIPVFFFSAYALNTWLNHGVKTLYVLELGEEKILAVYREKMNDMRIMFDIPSQDMINAIQEQFHPKFLSVNESATKPEVKSFYSDTEYKIQIEPIANLTEKNYAKNTIKQFAKIQDWYIKHTSLNILMRLKLFYKNGIRRGQRSKINMRKAKTIFIFWRCIRMIQN